MRIKGMPMRARVEPTGRGMGQRLARMSAARARVAPVAEGGAGCKGTGEDLPMDRGAHDAAGEVRGDDAHEPERAAEGRDRAGHQAGRQHRQKQDTPGGGPGKGRVLLAEQDDIQPLAIAESQDKADDQRPGHQHDLEIPAAGKTARHPAVEQFQALFTRRILQDRTERTEDETQHHAEHQQRRHRPEPGRDRDDQRRRHEGSEERRHRHGESREKGRRRAQRHGRNSRAQSRAAAHAHDVRIGQRVPEHRLHLRPARRQGAPGNNRRQHPRHPQFPQHRSFCPGETSTPNQKVKQQQESHTSENLWPPSAA